MGSTCITVYGQGKPAAAKQAKAAKANSPKIQIRGIVKDAFTGKPLPGISVSVDGFSSTFTGDKGDFSIGIFNRSSLVHVKGEGYQTKIVVVNSKNDIEVKLYEDTYTSYYSDVNLPYGRQSKFNTPYSLEAIDLNNNWQRTSESSDTYLQGRVSGLNAVRRSGTPGIGADLFLRGFSSLYTTHQPLVVVDGMLYDNNSYGSSLISGHVSNPISNIDLKDVDSYTLIKDGSSFYGTKGANGVLLVTTNRAKSQATKIDFAAYSGFNNRVSNLPVLNANDYRTFLAELLASNPAETPASIAAKPYMIDVPNDGYYNYHQNTDWQKEVLANSLNQNYYLKVAGGDNIATYGLSVGYLQNSGVLKNTDLQRYQMRFNADLKLSNKLTSAANLSYVNSSQNLQNEGISIKTNPLYLALVKAPFLYPYNVTSQNIVSPVFAGVDPLNFSNPTALIEDVQGTNKNYRFFGSVSFKYDVTKKVQATTLFGVNYDKIRENLFVPKLGVVPDTLPTAIVTNRLGSNTQRLFALYSDSRLSYISKLSHNDQFTVNAGIRYNTNQREIDYGLGFNSATDNYISVGSGLSTLRAVGGENGKWNWMSIYANANYGLLNKYFFSVNATADGSSRFGKEATGALTINSNKFAVMPSVSAAWLASSEPFLAGLKVLDLLKLRFTYGLTGNDDIGNYSSIPYYVSQNLLGSYGLDRGNIANPALKWETVKKTGAGLDLSFFNERLNISVDGYHNKTVDMLILEPSGTISGLDFVLTNNGEMTTTGADISINTRPINKRIKWDIGINISSYKNTVDKVSGNRLLTDNGAGGTILTEVGKPANLFYGYKTQGVYATDAEAAGVNNRKANGTESAFTGGDIRFVNIVDSKEDIGNKITAIDEDDRTVIGDPNPDFFGAVTSALSYKRWSVDAVLSFSAGNDIYNYTRRNLESMSGYANQLQVVTNRWKMQGQVTDVPKVAYGDPSGNARFSDRWIEDGSYLRLRTISVTYDLPKLTSAIKSAKVYLTGNNVITLTGYKGYDPEFSGSGSVFRQGTDYGLQPIFRTVQLGVRVGL